MLHKVRDWSASLNAFLQGLSLLEHRVLTLGVAGIGILCLLFPAIMASLITLTGILACISAAYLYWTVSQREEPDGE